MIYLLSHLVERAAEREAERDAYRVPGRGIRYAELARRAHRLAHALRADGVRRGDRVGIFMPRDLDSAVAVHGILAAGAVFVPIDPHAPAGALRRLTDDCELRHLISHPQQARTLQRLAEDGATGLRTIVGLDGDRGVAVAEALGVAVRSWNDLDAYPDGARPDLRVMEDDLAYLMYSSGSTGRPKGIVHTHRSGLAYARLSAATYAVVPEDRIGNHSPLHFDMSTFGYLTSPLVGATTLLIPEAYTKLAASLSQLIEKEQLTIWYSVPLALIQLATRGVLDERDLSSLRWVLFGGEPFARQHLHALMARWPNARFSNVYGPAEVNQCTYYHVPPPAEDADLSEPVPIGTIWDDTEGLILDDDDRPIEDDTPGELVIRSPTRMRGYWGRPDLDARAFYRRSAVGGFEQTFYRTGDLVQRATTGDLLFLGRKDRQVKVRGYRLELDEIERTLTSFEQVEEAGVVPVRARRPDGSFGEIEGLHAAVSAKPGRTIDPDALLADLREVVSWYAVPKTLDIVESFPRTTSGKIDRRRLRELAEADPAGDLVADAATPSPT